MPGAAPAAVRCARAVAANCEADVTWLGTLKARAGVAFDRALVFATGGFATAGVTARVSPAVAGTTGVFEERSSGWTVGVGTEMAINSAMSVKAEYGLHEFTARMAPVDSLNAGEITTVRPVVHTVKVGANWHF